MIRLILPLFLLVLLAPPVHAAGMGFIPDSCDAVVVFRPALALDPALLPDKAERARLETILAEISAAVGFDLRKDGETAGFLLSQASKFLEGGRPRGTLFAAGRIDPKKVLAKAGNPAPQKLADLELYPLGEGVVFGFAGTTALLGGLEETTAALMAAKKSALSGAGGFATLVKRMDDPATAVALSLRVDAASGAALGKLAGDALPVAPLLSGLARIEFHAGAKGAALALVGEKPEYAATVKPALEALVKTGAAAALAETLRAKALPEKDPGRADAIEGAELAQAVLGKAAVAADGAAVELAVPPEAFAGAGARLVSTLLRTFGRNYEIGRGADGERRCLGNMQALEGARDLAELEKKGDPGSFTPESLVKLGYLGKPPACPGGGAYEMRRDGKGALRVMCSVHGDMDAIHDKLFNPANVK